MERVLEVPGGPEVKHFDGFTSRRAAQPQRAPHPYNEICETLQANFRTEGQLAEPSKSQEPSTVLGTYPSGSQPPARSLLPRSARMGYMEKLNTN